MNKSNIDVMLKEINNLLIQIQEKKNKIKELKQINSQKSSLNYNKYIERITELDNTEQSIKMLMENKYFKYIKHIDFTDDLYVKQLNGFQLNKDLGCIIKSEENKYEISYSNRIISPDQKKVTYIYADGSEISNILDYSFYSLKKGIPLIPISIRISYNDNEDLFYEPHFRFYNRNNKTSFINSFPFQPKQISKIIFDFDEEININNCYCKLFSATYSILEDNYILIEIENENKLNSFNISLKTEDSVINFKYFFSEDNINFEEFSFEEGPETILRLKNNSNFFIKIVADNENVNIKEETTIKKTELYSNEIKDNFGIYSIPLNITSEISSIRITFPISSYKILKEKMSKLSEVNIDDYILEETSGLYVLKNEFIDYINSIDEKINNLKYIDDISILETDKKYFNFYVDSKKMKIYTSSFMDEINFFIEMQYPSVSNHIDKMFYTPYLFSISLKG